MGLIFNEKIAEIYRSGHTSAQGRAMDQAMERLLVGLVEPKPGERVLDIGSGFGDHLLMLGRMGLDITGIDASPHMILRAKERLGHRCTLKPAFAEDLPFEDNEFDLAVLIFTLEFLDDPVRALREAGRVAKRKVFIGAINGLSWRGLQKWFQGCFGHPLFSRARLFNLWQLKALVRNAYGESPTAWACAPVPEDASPGGGYERMTGHGLARDPFRFLLGVSVTMRYTVKADTRPIKIGLKRARQSLLGVKSFQDVNCNEGLQRNERGVPL